MNVKELFEQADSEEITAAFFLMNTFFYDYEKLSFMEKVDRAKNYKKAVSEHIKQFRSCEPMKCEEERTIFVYERKSEEYETRDQVDYSLTLVRNQEAKEKVKGSESLWNNEGKSRIKHYGIDLMPVEEIAACRISQESVKEIGMAGCCGKILFELFRFGLSGSERTKNIQDFESKLDIEEAMDSEEGESMKPNELYEDFYQDMLDSCEDENMKQYLILEHEFDKNTEAIREHFVSSRIEENHQQITDMIRREFVQ